jgi:hypothetical protein
MTISQSYQIAKLGSQRIDIWSDEPRLLPIHMADCGFKHFIAAGPGTIQAWRDADVGKDPNAQPGFVVRVEDTDTAIIVLKLGGSAMRRTFPSALPH